MGQENEEYIRAQKDGNKEYRDCVASGIYPYPQVLDDILLNVEKPTQYPLGIIEIPLDLIKGTKSAGRTAAFSRSFHPLLDKNTEFALKWIALCKSQMEDGIRDPIKCWEYLGRFYVEEGNKRVSVMRHFGAASIRGDVTRLIPTRRDTPETQAYFEYLDFYKLSKVNFIVMSKPGYYHKLLSRLGMEEDHVWTEEEVLTFKARYFRFRKIYHRARVENITTGDAFVTYLQVFPYSGMDDLTDNAIADQLYRLRAELRVANKGKTEAVEMQMEPVQEETKKSVTSTVTAKVIKTLIPPAKVKVGFLHEMNPETSAWTAAHEFGRSDVAQEMASKIETYSYFDVKSGVNDQETVEKAIKDGCTIIFTTSPKLITASLKGAVEHPNVRFLNCSVNMPYPSVRTYYGRIFEAKFITGAIAGALADNNKIGYVENYPIYGVMANINAFALGAKMVNPRAKVYLRWSCLPNQGDLDQWFRSQGISVVSNRDMRDPCHPSQQFGLYRLLPDGTRQDMASPFWHWGKYYQRILESLLTDGGKELKSAQAVNYWWGIGSGVVDVLLSRNLPQEVSRLAYLFKDGVRSALVSPFDMKLFDQQGQERYAGGKMMDPEAILHMDWLNDNVVGVIPPESEIIPETRALVKLLGIYRKDEE